MYRQRCKGNLIAGTQTTLSTTCQRCKGNLIAGTQTTLSTTRQRCKGNLIAGTQTNLSTTRELSAPRGHPHRRQTDDLITNTGAVNFIADIGGIADIANFNFTGFAGWHKLHHDGGIAEYQLEARSTTAAGGGPPRSASIVNFADFVGVADKVGNS
jgi:hypothetical protein